MLWLCVLRQAAAFNLSWWGGEMGSAGALGLSGSPTVDLLGRAVPTPLVPQGVAAEIAAGEVHTYEVPADARNETISLSVCDFSGRGGDLQLTVNGTAFETEQGLATLASVSLFSSNGTLTVSTPSNSSGTWQYQLGIGGSLSVWLLDSALYLVDTDFANALLVTSPLDGISSLLLSQYGTANAADTVAFLNNQTLGTSNFSLNIFPSDNAKMSVLGASHCAAQRSSLLNQNNADLSTTTRGRTKDLKSQFLVKGLNRSESYTAYLGLPSPQPGYLGGIMLSALDFTTKSSTSCQVIYNMSFCGEMAFAVPGNASSFTAAELTQFYDQMAQDRFQNFTFSMDQVDCDVDPVNMFSPLKKCSDCFLSYKFWLCTTTIPRCADMSNNASYLMERQPGQSRNPVIDEVIKPGPYKEILPCAELCYSLVRDCPVSLGFGCPSGTLLDMSYGHYSESGDVTCSYPGAVYDESGARLLTPALGMLLLLILFI